MLENNRSKFTDLFQEFLNSYPATLEGTHHVDRYEAQRIEGRQNFEAIVEAADRRDDVTDQVLLKLLPYADTTGNRQKGAWIHVVPLFKET